MSEAGARTRALLVEDDPNIVDLIRANLAVRGFETIVSNDGNDALELLDTEEPDIVLVDLMLPEADGFELCRRIRERSAVAVIVVSARGGERDKVTALNVGADDYMTKPFSVEELLARITATLRRTRASGVAEPGPPIVTAGDLRIDLTLQQVTKGGQTCTSLPPSLPCYASWRPTGGSFSAMPICCGASGARAIRPRPNTSASMCVDCGPSWNRTAVSL